MPDSRTPEAPRGETKKRWPWPTTALDGDRSPCTCGHYLGSHDGVLPHRCWVAGCSCRDFVSSTAPSGETLPEWVDQAIHWARTTRGATDIGNDAAIRVLADENDRLRAELSRLQRDREEDTKRIDAIENDPHLLARIRTGRNRIGVPNGGWLWSRTIDGHEEPALTFRNALDAAVSTPAGARDA